jgi:hypothetical protein
MNTQDTTQNGNFSIYSQPSSKTEPVPVELEFIEGIKDSPATVRLEIIERTNKAWVHHEKVLESFRNTIEFAIKSGTELNKVKDLVGHGKFQAHCKKHIPGLSKTTRGVYMRLAEAFARDPLMFEDCESITEGIKLLRDEEKENKSTVLVYGKLPDGPPKTEPPVTAGQTLTELEKLERLVAQIQDVMLGVDGLNRGRFLNALKPLTIFQQEIEIEKGL